MVNDTEPRYRLVDANGNVVGTLFAEADGTLKLQEGTSGNENELSLTTQGALEVEQISGGPIFTEAFPGTDPDVQLNNAIDAASVGDEIRLENTVYNKDRTISKSVTLTGTDGAAFRGTEINANWTLSGRVLLQNVFISSNSNLELQEFASYRAANGQNVSVTGDNAAVIGCANVDVTFQNGVSNGIADSLYAGSTATDNDGGNLIGDVI